MGETCDHHAGSSPSQELYPGMTIILERDQPGVDGPTTGRVPAARCRATPDGPSGERDASPRTRVRTLSPHVNTWNCTSLHGHLHKMNGVFSVMIETADSGPDDISDMRQITLRSAAPAAIQGTVASRRGLPGPSPLRPASPKAPSPATPPSRQTQSRPTGWMSP
jgi:hypothetical protein